MKRLLSLCALLLALPAGAQNPQPGIPITLVDSSGNPYTLCTPSYSGSTLVAQFRFVLVDGAGNPYTPACSGGGGGANFDVNGVPLISATTLNFQNSVGFNGLTFTFANTSAGNIQLGASGSLTVPGGGTGQATLTQFDLLAGSGNAPVTSIATGTSGQALVSAGASAYPSFSSTLSDVTSVNGTSIPAAQTLLYSGGPLGTPASGSMANLTNLSSSALIAALPSLVNGEYLTNNGTSLSWASGAGNITGSGSPAEYETAVFTSSSSITGVGPGTSGYPLVSGGASANPAYQQLALSGIAAVGADTILANATGSSASPTAVGLASATLAAITTNTAFTVAGSAGCSPTVASAGPYDGYVNIPSGCTGGSATITVTINGATGFTAPHGYHCTMVDHNQPFLPSFGETSSTSTTATFSIPAAYATSDVASLGCDGWF